MSMRVKGVIRFAAGGILLVCNIQSDLVLSPEYIMKRMDYDGRASRSRNKTQWKV